MIVRDTAMDWHDLRDDANGPVAMGSRDRLRWVQRGMAALLAVVFLRAVQLEWTAGEAFRAEASRPLERTRQIATARGRILARDGTVLASDEPVTELAVHYRYLEEPVNAAWLRAKARARLPKAERRLRERVAAEEQIVLHERAALHATLAQLCQVPPREWQARCRRIQERVSEMAAHVNERRRLAHKQNDADAETDASLVVRISRMIHDALTADDSLAFEPLVIAEETDYHAVLGDVPPAAAAEIRAHAERYPGVRVLDRTRRSYPLGELASHVVGHVSRDTADKSPAGRMGMERGYEAQLASRPGLETQFTDRRGNVLRAELTQPPYDGRDVVLSLDLALERTAESLLDQACEEPPSEPDSSASPAAGGAIVVMDIRNGEILVSASAPRFNPNVFVAGDSGAAERILTDNSHPLFDRVAKMTIPPGSLFKVVTAAALLESGAVDPEEPFHCQGYLHHPDRQRCFIFRRFGVGHGDLTLVDALAQSCNVYFYHFASAAGCAPVIEWAERFGLGQPTGIDLPDEAAGRVPTPDNIRQLEHHAWGLADTQALAIGQGSVAVTPLQMVRLMGAISNGGRLVTPRVIATSDRVAATAPPTDKPCPLQPRNLQIIREGLRRVVSDPNGTAHAALGSLAIPVAGKTGTAETGRDGQDHAWFAGYVPADSPRFAFVVALEHAGGGSAVAAPVARQLIERMIELGYFGPVEVVDRAFPPGKG